MPSQKSPSPELAVINAHVQQPKYRATVAESAWQLASTLLAFTASFTVVACCSRANAHQGLQIGSALLHGLVTVRVFMLFHDCGHGTFLPPGYTAATRTIHSILALLVVTPTAWSRNHQLHHQHVGNLAQEEYEWCETIHHTKAEYLALVPWQRMGLRLIRHPVPFFLMAPVLTWWVKFRVPCDMADGYTLQSKAVNTLGMLAQYYLFYTLGGGQLLGLFLLAQWFGALVGILLFHAQHVYEGGYIVSTGWQRSEASMRGSSLLEVPNVLKWFTMGIEYHHIHHFCTRVPGYNLQRCHLEAPAELFTCVHILGMPQWARSLRLQAWDEEKAEFVTFSEIEAEARHRGG